ncbi:uncharacterized protein [Hemitrygon akajei]|uniref:uncharacterized protein isoform X2 n=1 Tax=Hemitrygon akajei TaxID=2704970 RepID=UPI003BF9F521
MHYRNFDELQPDHRLHRMMKRGGQRWPGLHWELRTQDVRSPAEYEVSHLEGAIRVDPQTTDMEKVVKELGLAGSPERTVVCYCTVGYHASQMAQKLSEVWARDSGPSVPVMPEVYNLDGGLRKWSQENRPMVDGSSHLTSQVHPYSQLWDQLLEADFKPPE